MTISALPWRIADELIEQPSWGGRYIIDIKGLGIDPAWAGKKVGQSYELARSSVLIDPESGEHRALPELIAEAPSDLLGAAVISKFGPDLSLLIKLTQAKGNSFQVHLPVGKKLGHWLPKPEAWFYLAPGLFTFGLRKGVKFADFSDALLKIDALMKDLSCRVTTGAIDVQTARALAQVHIAQIDPKQYVNTVNARPDDIVDLTAGGIHHSWEEDDDAVPEGNLVYEVQVDVPDWQCSMRGFDKGKMLDDGGLRDTHVRDYLATIEQDDYHNDLSHHIRKPIATSQARGATVEGLFQTPYFLLDRIVLAPGMKIAQSTEAGFHHLFIFNGSARIGDCVLDRGQSYIVPAVAGNYELSASESGATIFKTYLPTA